MGLDKLVWDERIKSLEAENAKLQSMLIEKNNQCNNKDSRIRILEEKIANRPLLEDGLLRIVEEYKVMKATKQIDIEALQRELESVYDQLDEMVTHQVTQEVKP